MSRFTEDELLRLACIHAETDRASYAEAVKDCPDFKDEYERSLAFVKAVRKYRIKRWGKTGMDRFLETAKSVSLEEVLNEKNKNA